MKTELIKVGEYFLSKAASQADLERKIILTTAATLCFEEAEEASDTTAENSGSSHEL